MGLEQNIAQLQVAVDDAKAVDVIHALGYLLCSPQQCSLHSHSKLLCVQFPGKHLSEKGVLGKAFSGKASPN